MAIARYDPYTDSFIHEGNDESITATISIDSMPKNIIQMNVVELSSECIDKIADAVVKKLKAEQTEPNSKVSEIPTSSEKPNNCTDCECTDDCSECKEAEHGCKDEPQTDTEIAKAIVHKMIDDAVIAEDAYPDLRQKMHDAVDEYEPQIEREGE